MKEKRKILFISPAFFGYELSIKKALENYGFEVDYFDERVSNNSFTKAILRVKKSLIKTKIEKYYKNILTIVKEKKYNYFLLIKGDVIPSFFLENFKKDHPSAILIFYTFDSLKNKEASNGNVMNVIHYFDKKYSFDFEDVEANPSFKLKHLFYTQEFKNHQNISKKYDISFIGTLHSNRYEVMRKLFYAFKNTFVFYYMPAKWFFIYQKITKKDFRPVKYKDISFSKISREEVAEIFKSSKSVLDIQRFGQSGLTMRTFEVLASGAILVTTNPQIKNTDFYDEKRIVIIENLNNVTEKINVIKEKISKLDNENRENENKYLEKYFVDNWIKEFFET